MSNERVLSRFLRIGFALARPRSSPWSRAGVLAFQMARRIEGSWGTHRARGAARVDRRLRRAGDVAGRSRRPRAESRRPTPWRSATYRASCLEVQAKRPAGVRARVATLLARAVIATLLPRFGVANERRAGRCATVSGACEIQVPERDGCASRSRRHDGCDASTGTFRAGSVSSLGGVGRSTPGIPIVSGCDRQG